MPIVQMGKLSSGGGEQSLDHELESDSQLFRRSLGTKDSTGPRALVLAPIFVLWPQMGNSVSWFKHWLILLF